MAYSIDGTDIVINGWEKGIFENPYSGINDMRGVNVISIPGEASVSFAPTAQFMGSDNGAVSSASAANDTLTITSNTSNYQSGMALVFTGASLPGGVTAGVTYWMEYVNGNTIKIYTEASLTNLVNITSSGTGTWASIDVGEITYFEKSSGVALDRNGRAWDSLAFGLVTYRYMGNPVSGTQGLSSTIGNGLIYYKGFLFVFYNSRICYCQYVLNAIPGGAFTWINEWDPTTGAIAVGTQVFNTQTGTQNVHEALIGVNDGTVYITDGSFVASLFEKPGSTFDPTNTATYTWAKQALAIPATDTAQCLAELGSKLLVGGSYNIIYPWDRVSVGYNNAILIADNGVVHMITVNTNTYIFAGKRGRIYVTNGSQANLYTKIPDHISGGLEPIFTWKNCAYNKNQLYFGIAAQNNSQSAITSYNGLWAIDITTNALRVPVICSNANAGVTAIHAFTSVASGFGLMIAWKNSTSYGIDITGSAPYTGYSAYIITDMLPVGRFLTKRTFQNLEFKLSTALTSNEGIKISGRTDIKGSWTVIGENTVTGTISDTFILPFEQMVWLQLKIEMKSSNANSSFVRLYELRLR